MKKAVSFVREKKIYCGDDYMEIDIIPRVEIKTGRPGTRCRKEKISAPKQRNLNDKNAKRYFVQLLNSNFGWDDLHVTVTYAKANLPDSVEAAEREAANFIRRIGYRRKKQGLGALKYVIVTESVMEGSGEKPVRIHHHIIMNGGLDRDAIEDLWRMPKQKGQKKGKKLGYANTDRLQPDDFGLEALARYLTKRQVGKKRWSASQNLIKPWFRKNDGKYSKKTVERMAMMEEEGREFFEKKYPGWMITLIKPEYNEITGWAIYLKLKRKTE